MARARMRRSRVRMVLGREEAVTDAVTDETRSTEMPYGEGELTVRKRCFRARPTSPHRPRSPHQVVVLHHRNSLSEGVQVTPPHTFGPPRPVYRASASQTAVGVRRNRPQSQTAVATRAAVAAITAVAVPAAALALLPGPGALVLLGAAHLAGAAQPDRDGAPGEEAPLPRLRRLPEGITAARATGPARGSESPVPPTPFGSPP